MPTRVSRTTLVNAAFVVGWAALIWVLGGGGFSHSETSRFLVPLLDWLIPDISAETRRAFMGLVRKSAHVAEYAVFGVLVLRLVTGLERLRLMPSIAFSMAAVIGLAMLDEGRQGLLTSRSGSLFDVGLDAAGGLFGVVLAVTLATVLGSTRVGVPGWREPVSRSDH